MKNPVALDFDFSQKGAFSFFGENFAPVMNPGGDFWRVHLDDGEIREMEACSSGQTDFSVETTDDGATVTYNSLVDVIGRRFNIVLTIYIKKQDGVLRFSYDIFNRHDSWVRVNEVQLPFIDVLEFPCPACDEVLYSPNGLGQKIKNPREWIKRHHTEYTAADYKQTWYSCAYPPSKGHQGQLSMPWQGFQLGRHYLHFGLESEAVPMVTFALGASPRNTPSRFIAAQSRFPGAEPGEHVHMGEAVLALFEGDFRDGVSFYKAWCEKTWYKGRRNSPQWVRSMNGWQRIILKHQYGEIFFKYEDLPRLYLEGKKYGLDTLLVFGWWKGRFDNNYPEYEADPALGGAEGLKKAIDEVHRLGGRVCLYTNGNLIDIKTGFYRDCGCRICTKNLDETNYFEQYQFGNGGTMLKTYGYKTFVTACHTTPEWQARLIENGKLKLSFGADCIFYDQLCSCFKLCFDKSHPHGNRIDGEAQGRFENVKALTELLESSSALVPDAAMGSEWVTDRYVTQYDFTHGYGFAQIYYPNNAELFPELFRTAFPECIISNRLIHDAKPGFKAHLNYAFAVGLIFDVSIYRGRVFGIEGLPEYAEHIAALCKLRNKFKAYFSEGIFESAYGEDGIPDGLLVYRFILPETGKGICTVFNNSENELSAVIGGTEVSVLPGDVEVVEI